MSTDEIKAGPELDALIAEKVMGFKFPAIDPTRKPPIEGEAYSKDQIEYFEQNGLWFGVGRVFPNVRRYSTDIAAAWEVVANLKSRGWYIGIHEDPEGTWCTVTQPIRGYWDARAPTAPLAICRTALASVTAEGGVTA